MRLCCDYGVNISRNSSPVTFISSEQSTQQANCYTKHAVTNRIPVTAKLIRVNEASDWISLTKRFEYSGIAYGSWKEKQGSVSA